MTDVQEIDTAQPHDRFTRDLLQQCFKQYPVQIVHSGQMHNKHLKFVPKGVEREQLEKAMLRIERVWAAGPTLRFQTVDLATHSPVLLRWELSSDSWMQVSNEEPSFKIPADVTLI